MLVAVLCQLRLFTSMYGGSGSSMGVGGKARFKADDGWNDWSGDMDAGLSVVGGMIPPLEDIGEAVRSVCRS